MNQLNLGGTRFVAVVDLAKVVGTKPKILLGILKQAGITVKKFGCPWYVNYDAWTQWCNAQVNTEYNDECQAIDR